MPEEYYGERRNDEMIDQYTEEEYNGFGEERDIEDETYASESDDIESTNDSFSEGFTSGPSRPYYIPRAK